MFADLGAVDDRISLIVFERFPEIGKNNILFNRRIGVFECPIKDIEAGKAKMRVFLMDTLEQAGILTTEVSNTLQLPEVQNFFKRFPVERVEKHRPCVVLLVV